MPTAQGLLPTATLRVPFRVSSVSAARRAMAEDLAERGVDRRVVDDAVLVLSEVLSNALKHARPLITGDLRVRWRCSREAVELEVTDGGAPTRPRLSSVAGSATGGRGLSIVRDLARQWGVEDEGESTTVWAVVPTEGPASRR